MRFLCIMVCLGLATVINARAVHDWNRNSRAAYYLIGCRASINLLMKGTKEVTPSPNKYTRLFLKSGDYESVVNDFQAAKLTANDGLMGHAGTRNVILRKYGDDGLPTITIKKFQPNYTGQNIDGRVVTTDKIIYDGITK